MVQYFPGPYEVEIFYVELGITHKQRINCRVTAEGAVGDPFSAFSAERRNGAQSSLQVLVDEYITLMRPLFSGTSNITIANLYKYVPNTFDKAFLGTYDINLTGSGVGSAVANQQLTLTFTTQFGNNVRLAYLDVRYNLSSRIPIRDATAEILALSNYVTGPTSWIVARDGSYPIGKLNSSQGQNEALFKARNR